MSKQKVYRAAWPHVTVGILDEAGSRTVVAFADGGILPPNADPEDVKRLVTKGALVEVEPAEAEPKAKEPEPAKPEPDPVTARASFREPEPATPAKVPAKPGSKTGNGS